MTASAGPSLRQRMFRALFWSAAQTWAARAILFVIYMVLARLLAPAQFGVVAGAAVVLALLEVLYEQGFGDALVQRASLTQEDLNGAFWVSVGISVALCAAVVGLAGWITSWMGIPESRAILVVGSLGLPVTAAGVCQQALYRRALDYRWLAVRAVSATLFSGLVGVGCALSGMGAWSLVCQTLGAAVANTALLWIRPKFWPSASVDLRSFSRLLDYSSRVFANRLVDFGNVRFMDFVIVMRAGPVALGMYAIGSRVYLTAMQLLISVLLDVAHSGFSRVAADPDKLLRGYYRAVEMTAALALPLFMMLAASAPEVTAVAFGEQWLQAAPIMHALCLLGGLQCIQFYNGTCFNASGRPGLTLLLNLVRLVATASALFVVHAQSIERLVEVYAVVVAFMAPLSFGLAARYLGVSVRRVVSVTWPYVGAGVASYAAVRLGGRYLASSIPPLPRLCLEIVAGGVVYVLACSAVSFRRCARLIDDLRGRRVGFP